VKENIVIVNCKASDEAHQILNRLRQNSGNQGYEISQAAVAKKDAGRISLEDSFTASDPMKGRGWTGGLIGSLVGVLGGPLGALIGEGIGALIGNSMDERELEEKSNLLRKVGECLSDGETALLLMVKEEDERALSARLTDFQVSITRMDASEVASEIERAEEQKRRKEAAEESEKELPELEIISGD
jgi:uncharacterized membrane protein